MKNRIGKIRPVKFVPRIGRLVSVDYLAKIEEAKHGSKGQPGNPFTKEQLQG